MVYPALLPAGIAGLAGLGLDAGVGDLVMSRPFVRRSGDWLRKAAGPVHGCGPVCFAAGTGIVTRRGQIAVEALRPGDQVLQVDGGFAPIRWIGSASHSGGEMECNEWLRPIRIRCGAVGNGLPQRDLLVSRDHRCLVRSDAALSLFGQREVLVAAGDLRGIPGVATDPAPEGVEYWHFQLDRLALGVQGSDGDGLGRGLGQREGRRAQQHQGGKQQGNQLFHGSCLLYTKY